MSMSFSLTFLLTLLFGSQDGPHLLDIPLLSQTRIVLAPSETLLVHHATSTEIHCTLIDPLHRLSLRSVTMSVNNAQITEKPRIGEPLEGLNSFRMVPNSLISDLVFETFENNRFRCSIYAKDPFYQWKWTWIGMPYSLPLISEQAQLIFLPFVDEAKEDQSEGVCVIELDEGGRVRSQLLHWHNHGAYFGSHRVFGQSMYFLSATRDSLRNHNVLSFDSRDGAVVATRASGVQVEPCSCGLWVRDAQGSAKLYEYPLKGENEPQFVINETKDFLSSSQVQVVGGVTKDGSVWRHSCEDGAVSFVGKVAIDPDTVISGGWGRPEDEGRQTLWLYLRPDLEDLDRVEVQLYKID